MRRTNIAKHSYIKGRKGTARAIAHVNYIQYRDGEDKNRLDPARPFFDKERDEVLGLELKTSIRGLGWSRCGDAQTYPFASY